jgi:DNA-binding MarR family transcriptional regulator
MAELAERAALSRSRLTHTVARLEKDDILRRERCDDDGRGVQAVLTSRGVKLLKQAADTHVRGVQDHLIAHASRQELATIGAVMERVIADLHGKTF